MAKCSIYWPIPWEGEGEWERWNPTFTEHFLLPYAIAFNPHDNPVREISSPSFHREINKRLKEVKRLVQGHTASEGPGRDVSPDPSPKLIFVLVLHSQQRSRVRAF